MGCLQGRVGERRLNNCLLCLLSKLNHFTNRKQFIGSAMVIIQIRTRRASKSRTVPPLKSSFSRDSDRVFEHKPEMYFACLFKLMEDKTYFREHIT